MKLDLSDVLVIIGVGLIGLGTYFIFPPAAALFVGAFCIIAGLYSASAKPRKGGDKP